MVFGVVKIWSAMEKILYQQAELTDQRLHGWIMYICALLDISVWHGACLLVVEKYLV